MNERDRGTRWYEEVTRQQWTVLLIASLGWVFDTFEGQVYVSSMNEAMPDLLPGMDRIGAAERAGRLAYFNNIAFGAFLMGQAAARAMLEAAPVDGVRGTILFTGASAGVKGFPQSAPFAMGKFAQRGLAQSMARELHPHGIHVAWINIDGGIRNPSRPERMDSADSPDSMLDPDAIAHAYRQLVRQHRSAWSSELTLRPWTERF